MPYGRPIPAGICLDKDFKELEAIVVTQGHFNGGVFKVLQRSTRRICLEKRFKPEHIIEGIWRKETLLLRNLRHRNISEYIDAFEEPGPIPRASIYMDYCDLGSLDDCLKKFSDIDVGIDEEVIWNAFVDLSNAVGYIQYGIQDTVCGGPREPGWRKIVHRDIAPRNIFLKTNPGRPFPIVVLGDFGCASIVEWVDDVVGGNYIGHDPYWNPPETPLNGTPSDIWSIGAIIQEMMRLDGEAERYGPLIDGHRIYKGADLRYSKQLNKALAAFMHRDWRSRPRIREIAPRLGRWRFEVTGRG